MIMVSQGSVAFIYKIITMKKKFLIFVLFAIFVLSFVTFLMIINYLDPYENKVIAIISMAIAFFFSMMSVSTLFLYAFKKIYFRWQVYLHHLMTSFRQGVMIAIFWLWLGIFSSIGAPIFVSWFLLFIILICIELFIKNMEA